MENTIVREFGCMWISFQNQCKWESLILLLFWWMKFCSSGCSQRAMWRITHPVKTGPSRPPSSFWYWGWTHPTPAASGLGQKYCDKQKFKKILYCSDSFVSEDRQLCGIKPLRQTRQGKEKKQRTLQPLAVPAALTLSCSSLCNLCHSEREKQGEIYAMLTLSLCFCTRKRGERGSFANPVRQLDLFATDLSPGGRC